MMFAKFVLCVFLVVFPLLDAQRQRRFFRKDYTYIDDTSAFYKINPSGTSWDEAKTNCEREGATLFYPVDDAERVLVTKMWNKTHAKILHTWIGISDQIVEGAFLTVDGLSIHDVFNTWESGQPDNYQRVENCVTLSRIEGELNDWNCWNNLAFICKKTLLSLEWNKDCNVPDIDYKYNADLGKCYKFHQNPTNWSEAAQICNHEQAYLTIINGDKEDKHLVKITAAATGRENIAENVSEFVWVGVRDFKGWITVKGMTLRDSGFVRWAVGEPSVEGQNTCGSMTTDGALKTMTCSEKNRFICELDVSLRNLEVDSFNRQG